ncbi:hypothetical protein AAG906_015931 [Vitis piasezkii]
MNYILNAIHYKGCDSRVGNKVIAVGTREQTSKDVTMGQFILVGSANVKMDERYATISTVYLPSGICIILKAIRYKGYDNKVIAAGTQEQTSKDVSKGQFILVGSANVKMDESYVAISTTYLPSGICIILNAIRCKGYDSRLVTKWHMGTNFKGCNKGQFILIGRISEEIP